jgi:TRAP-type C4-dicarboxylate transport system substrate-binding protein
MFDRLGVQSTPLGMLEIYSALSRGTVDGQDNGFDLAIPPRFHEAAKFWSATDHVNELVGFFVSERFWRGAFLRGSRSVQEGFPRGRRGNDGAD